jgi:light-regulated signal transduction histidine kinase (bacteriophytochrome)
VEEGLRAEYAAALAAYLAGGGEDALSLAYELGRRALVDEANIAALAGVHHDALRALPLPAGDPALARAAEFLAEALAPFEMTHRGFREANTQLQALNEELRSKNDELGRTARALRAAKEGADAANRELEAFSYSVAHDLRAPLRAVDGFSQLLAEALGEGIGAAERGYLERIRAGSRRMDRLIDDLLTLSRITRAELTRQPVDLGALAAQIGAELTRREPGRSVALEVAAGLTAAGDPSLLAILLENLLGNAWKFTGRVEAARVEVGRELSGGEAVFFVRDNGAGFDMAYAGKLFAPFQRLHSTREFEGTGVGLATAQRIVSRHGGRIWADAAVGRGAAFFFTLP